MKKLVLITLLLTACADVAPPSQATAAQNVTNVAIHVDGMVCGGCEATIRTSIGALKGVQSVTASHKDKKVVVSFDEALIKLDDIKKAIAALGYTVT